MAQSSVAGLPGVWAGDGLTTIPPVPVSGSTYRDTAVTEATIRAGSVYDTLANSADFNQFMYVLSLLLQQLRTQGILTYRNDVDYTVDAIVLASNGNFYKAAEANGPSSTVVDPGVNPGTAWVLWPDESIRAATTLVQGLVELATNAEAQTGTDATRAVTPAALTSRTATESRTGILELATQAEVTAGTDDTRAVTPLKLAQALAGVEVDAVETLGTTGSNAALLVTFTNGTTATVTPNAASNTTRGAIEIATQAEVDAGTDTERAVTPETLANYSGLGVSLIETRTTGGNWTLTNLSTTKPLILGLRNTSTTVDARAVLRIASGAFIGSVTATRFFALRAEPSLAGQAGANLITVPTATSVVIEIDSLVSGSSILAYQ